MARQGLSAYDTVQFPSAVPWASSPLPSHLGVSMRPKRLTPPVRRTTRRWRTPPAITHGAEPFEGLTVLDEVAGPLGFLLWQAARDVNLWADVSPEERAGLFVPGADALLHALIRSAGVDVQLESPLMTIVRMAG